MGRKPYFFIGTEIFQNAGNQKACFLDTLEKKKPIDIFIFLNFYQYNLEKYKIQLTKIWETRSCIPVSSKKACIDKISLLFEYTHIPYMCKHIYSHHLKNRHVNTDTYRTLISISSYTHIYSH